MTCQKFEESIYLYTELLPTERIAVEEHLQQCVSCRALLQEVQSMTLKIKTIPALHPTPRNNARLTHKIMEEIERSKSKHSGWLISLDQLLHVPMLRYSLGALSILIILSFITEQNITQPTYKESETHELSSILNTSHVLKTIETTRRSSIHEKRISLFKCLSTNMCDQLGYSKTKKNYEQSH